MRFSVVILCLSLLLPSLARAQDVPNFTVRPGYTINLAAQDIGQVRFLEFDDKGTLFVSQPNTGTIATLREKNGKYEKIANFTTGKPTVHGMHFFNGWLWFTQSGAIWKARDTNGDGMADEEINVIKDGDLPSGGGHWWRSILVTPTGFYTSIGDDSNANDHTGDEREKIWFFNLDGSGKRLFCSGIRNTEKLRLRPGTNEVWGADHGSDNFGGSLGEKRGNQPVTDKIPPCEFNHYVQDGFYGHPFIMGNGMPRLEYKDRPDILDLATKTILPAWPLGAHWAPNGWMFATKNTLGEKGTAYIACHGSWNSTASVGYRVEAILFDAVTGQPYGSQEIVSSIASNGDIVGRPTDCAEAPDGSILFSDDTHGKIYRISRTQPGK